MNLIKDRLTSIKAAIEELKKLQGPDSWWIVRMPELKVVKLYIWSAKLLQVTGLGVGPFFSEGEARSCLDFWKR